MIAAAVTAQADVSVVRSRPDNTTWLGAASSAPCCWRRIAGAALWALHRGRRIVGAALSAPHRRSRIVSAASSAPYHRRLIIASASLATHRPSRIIGADPAPHHRRRRIVGIGPEVAKAKGGTKGREGGELERGPGPRGGRAKRGSAIVCRYSRK